MFPLRIVLDDYRLARMENDIDHPANALCGHGRSIRTRSGEENSLVRLRVPPVDARAVGCDELADELHRVPSQTDWVKMATRRSRETMEGPEPFAISAGLIEQGEQLCP